VRPSKTNRKIETHDACSVRNMKDTKRILKRMVVATKDGSMAEA
jgi:hypothetical protein